MSFPFRRMLCPFKPWSTFCNLGVIAVNKCLVRLPPRSLDCFGFGMDIEKGLFWDVRMVWLTV